jgi:hypothetical protein
MKVCCQAVGRLWDDRQGKQDRVSKLGVVFQVIWHSPCRKRRDFAGGLYNILQVDSDRVLENRVRAIAGPVPARRRGSV